MNNHLIMIFISFYLKDYGPAEVKLRYNDYFDKPTRNNIRLKGSKIETYGDSNEHGLTICDFILPPNFKVERIKDCKSEIISIQFNLLI